MLLAAHHSKCSSKLYLLARAKSQERFEKHSAEILAKFERDEAAGFYIVGKIANQLIAHDDISQMRAKAGKKGGLAKQQKKLQAIAIANDNQLLTESDSESDIKPSSELESSSDSASSQKKEPSQAACRLAVLLKAEIQR
ncbi:MAG: hypothetical protein JWQ87_127, partial [Candidatus Sulfotelmatobacter sp.]|nr:hypothetical protein [Candidatus Sulfotelmatobacter sp.]